MSRHKRKSKGAQISAPFVTRQSANKGQKRFAVAKHGRLGPRFAGSSLSINEELRRDLAAIKAQSKRAGNDDGYVTKFLNMCETHIIGPNGFSFWMECRDSSGVKDKRANAAVEDAWRRWGKKGTCDVTGQYSWTDIENMFVRTVAEGGEILVRCIDGFPNEFGFAVQLLDCDQLPISYNRDLPDGNRIRMGVELDDFDRPVAYHLLSRHPGEMSYHHGSTHYQRIPASDIALRFMPFRLHQCRGLPWAHAALLELHHLYGHREAVLTGARIAASKMMAYEPDPDLEPEDAVDEEFIEEVEPGMAVIAPHGYTMKTLDFQSKGDDFGAITKFGMRGTSSGLDVSYNSVSNDLEGVNFSSLRQAVLEDRDGWKKKQRWTKENLHEDVFPRALRMFLLMGQVSGYGVRHLSYLNKPMFQGRRWEWIDPLKDRQADSEGINNMTLSPLAVIRESGQQPDVVIEEILDFEEQVAAIREKRAKFNNNQPQQKESAPQQETLANA